MATPDTARVSEAVARIKRHTNLPVAFGFGVKTAAHAGAIAQGVDAVVVGSALVETVRSSLDRNGKATARTVGAVSELIAARADGVQGARRRVAQDGRSTGGLAVREARRGQHL